MFLCMRGVWAVGGVGGVYVCVYVCVGVHWFGCVCGVWVWVCIGLDVCGVWCGCMWVCGRGCALVCVVCRCGCMWVCGCGCMCGWLVGGGWVVEWVVYVSEWVLVNYVFTSSIS